MSHRALPSYRHVRVSGSAQRVKLPYPSWADSSFTPEPRMLGHEIDRARERALAVIDRRRSLLYLDATRT